MSQAVVPHMRRLGSGAIVRDPAGVRRLAVWPGAGRLLITMIRR
jgi:hypothetical protein